MLTLKVLLLMVLCHIIDDFVLQPVCLSKLKQKSWWEANAPDDLYKDDYKVALFIHALSWSIMIHLPIIFLWPGVPGLVMCMTVFVNCLAHAWMDDRKANEKAVNLRTDQSFHLFQIFVTFIMLLAFR